jgi:hypothetical protein
LDNNLRFAIASFITFGSRIAVTEFLKLSDSALVEAFFTHQKICEVCQELKEEMGGREIAHKLTRLEIYSMIARDGKKYQN